MPDPKKSIVPEDERYDQIGRGYTATRLPDPRIARYIDQALGDAHTVVNVGAGTGAYEPPTREVIAVEPSATMIAQRPATAARVIRAHAESLPLPDKSVDAALAIQTLNHWSNLPQALAEMRRVARKRVVVFMYDPTDAPPFWLFERYLPQLWPEDLLHVRQTLDSELGPMRGIRVPIPCDCTDGFLTAFWARPEAYLDLSVRRNMSSFRLAEAGEIDPALKRLSADLASGEWDRIYGELRRRPEMFLGHHVLVAELDSDRRVDVAD